MTKNFRLPRKLKKQLKKGFWLYESDADGNSLQARPATSQEDYTALKQGRLRNIFDPREIKKRRIELKRNQEPEIYVSDEILKNYVQAIFREDLRAYAYDIFMQAKNNPRAVKAYFHFINAYQLEASGDSSYGNICAMTLELAEKLLRDNPT